jgi:hypothetical protein
MKIISTSGKKGFILSYEDQILLEVSYKNWFSSNAFAVIDENFVEVKPKGFWGKHFLIYKNDLEKGKIDFQWKGSMIITFNDEWDIERNYILKPKGILKKQFELLDEKENIIFTTSVSFDWRRFKQNFDITDIRENYHENTFIELAFYTSYAIKVYLAKQSAAAS